MTYGYVPVLEATRGNIVESLHYGAFVAVDGTGKIVAGQGDTGLVTFLRSSAKPFQALPFVEMDGDTHFGLTPRELALMCASHSGTDDHVAVLRGMQAKIGVTEADLLCGVHTPYHEPTAKAMLLRGEAPTPNRHNCSGKHTGMLAHARLRGYSTEEYIRFDHPVQTTILQAFSEMCSVPVDQIELGVDGCSAPVFAIPLYNAALSYARLCDPSQLEPRRAQACRRITSAMLANPDMVAGPGRFDTRLMTVAGGRILTKAGAEGYQTIGIMPGALYAGSPAIGIAVKAADGDLGGRVRPCVCTALLRQLGALSDEEVAALPEFAPRPIHNWRGLPVGDLRPAFTVEPLVVSAK